MIKNYPLEYKIIKMLILNYSNKNIHKEKKYHIKKKYILPNDDLYDRIAFKFAGVVQWQNIGFPSR